MVTMVRCTGLRLLATSLGTLMVLLRRRVGRFAGQIHQHHHHPQHHLQQHLALDQTATCRSPAQDQTATCRSPALDQTATCRSPALDRTATCRSHALGRTATFQDAQATTATSSTFRAHQAHLAPPDCQALLAQIVSMDGDANSSTHLLGATGASLPLTITDLPSGLDGDVNSFSTLLQVPIYVGC